MEVRFRFICAVFIYYDLILRDIFKVVQRIFRVCLCHTPHIPPDQYIFLFSGYSLVFRDPGSRHYFSPIINPLNDRRDLCFRVKLRCKAV